MTLPSAKWTTSVVNLLVVRLLCFWLRWKLHLLPRFLGRRGRLVSFAPSMPLCITKLHTVASCAPAVCRLLKDLNLAITHMVPLMFSRMERNR